MTTYKYDYVNGVKVELTAEQIKEYEDRDKAWESEKSNRDLQRIKNIRQEFLQQTDWWVLRGEITTEQTAWRKSLRDIPQDYSADKYDELLARDDNGNLTHSVWSKP